MHMSQKPIWGVSGPSPYPGQNVRGPSQLELEKVVQFMLRPSGGGHRVGKPELDHLFQLQLWESSHVLSRRDAGHSEHPLKQSGRREGMAMHCADVNCAAAHTQPTSMSD